MHNFPSHIRVSTDKAVTLTQAKTILKLCIDNGVKVYSNVFENIVDKNYPNYHWSIDDKCISQNCSTPKEDSNKYIFVSFTEFCNYIKGIGKEIKAPFREELDLNNKYTAIVTKDGVKVGCQIFSHSVIEQLYKLSKKAQNDKT